MVGSDRLAQGLACLDQRRWKEADDHLSAASTSGALPADVVERLAFARLLTGRQEQGEETLVDAHGSFLRSGDGRGAARCAFWLGLQLMLRGEHARGGGWLGRAHEVLAGHDECAEQGLLMIPEAIGAMFAGHAVEAEAAFVRARALGVRVGAPDVVAFAQLGIGQCLVRQGRAEEGLVALDRVMADVEAEPRLNPALAGIAYCAVIEECQRVFDVSRARAWTTALSRWLDEEPDLVAYRGHCMVYRAEVVQRHGDWGAAVDESQRARDQLSTPPGHPATGLALYRLGELHRLRGEFGEAEAAYLEGNRWGHDPQPGLAMLRLGQGDVDAAAAAIRRVLLEVSEAVARCQVLAAAVRILVAAGDVDGAGVAAAELTSLAASLASSFLQALAAHAEGTVAVAAGRFVEAVAPLQSALRSWLEFQAPYEEAMTRAALGEAYRGLGDDDSARVELDIACTLLEGLGAAPDVARLRGASTSSLPPASPLPLVSPLSLRELQVLRLVATGATNRSIADALYISVRTVDRHVSNLYTKLGVTSRTAATAFAYQHDLV
jgi:DNA-binding CsgD family transcriptional regulator/tetratricopeptide (TPR) repeat protein